jgi:hypothetical protein
MEDSQNTHSFIERQSDIEFASWANESVFPFLHRNDSFQVEMNGRKFWHHMEPGKHALVIQSDSQLRKGSLELHQADLVSNGQGESAFPND